MAIVNHPTPCNPYFNSIPHFLENLNRENSQANMKETLYKYETDCNQLSYEMYFFGGWGAGAIIHVHGYIAEDRLSGQMSVTYMKYHVSWEYTVKSLI